MIPNFWTPKSLIESHLQILDQNQNQPITTFFCCVVQSQAPRFLESPFADSQGKKHQLRLNDLSHEKTILLQYTDCLIGILIIM